MKLLRGHVLPPCIDTDSVAKLSRVLQREKERRLLERRIGPVVQNQRAARRTAGTHDRRDPKHVCRIGSPFEAVKRFHRNVAAVELVPARQALQAPLIEDAKLAGETGLLQIAERARQSLRILRDGVRGTGRRSGLISVVHGR